MADNGRAGAIDHLERASWIDAPASLIDHLVRRLLGPRVVRDLASGVGLGHPVHPALVALPIGLWTGAAICDTVGAERRTSRILIGAGLAAAMPATLAGWSDWLDTEGAERRVGLTHAATNALAISAMGWSWCARRRPGKGKVPSACGLAALAVAGWLGGHLSYAMGVGVDANAFATGPSAWAPVPEFDEQLPGPTSGVADGEPLVALKVGNALAVLGGRCSHRGGALADGQRRGDCIECPWHGSRFDVSTGRVRRGPASIAQPTYAVRVTPEGIEVRRSEPRALRNNVI